MATLRALERRRAERVEMTRTLLAQRASMERVELSEVEFVCFRLGCSIAEGEALVQAVRRPGLTEQVRKLLKRIERDDSLLNDRREYTAVDLMLEENINRKDGKSRLDQLDRVAEYWSLPGSSRPDQNPENGSTSSSGGQSSRRPGSARPKLNPRFVEWLMGWPIGWTGSELAATEWSRWRQLSRSAFLRLVR